MTRLLSGALLTAVLLHLTGCDAEGSGSSGTLASRYGNLSPAPMTWEVLYSSTYVDPANFTTKGTRVLTSQYSLDQLFSNYSFDDPPVVDFGSHRVMLVDMGGRNSGGYSIHVTEVDEYPDFVVAIVELVKPGVECGVTDAFTNPYEFTALPTTKEILVREELVIHECD